MKIGKSDKRAHRGNDRLWFRQREMQGEDSAGIFWRARRQRIADVATFVAEEISVQAEKRKTGLPGLWNISDPDPAVRI